MLLFYDGGFVMVCGMRKFFGPTRQPSGLNVAADTIEQVFHVNLRGPVIEIGIVQPPGLRP